MTKHRGYMKTAAMEKLIADMLPSIPMARFIDGKFTTGYKSKHRTLKARMWRTILRLEGRRESKPT